MPIRGGDQIEAVPHPQCPSGAGLLQVSADTLLEVEVPGSTPRYVPICIALRGVRHGEVAVFLVG